MVSHFPVWPCKGGAVADDAAEKPPTVSTISVLSLSTFESTYKSLCANHNVPCSPHLRSTIINPFSSFQHVFRAVNETTDQGTPHTCCGGFVNAALRC